MRELFEKFAVSHFGDHIKALLKDFDEEDGYHDQIINGMWIGFCGHAALTGDL